MFCHLKDKINSSTEQLAMAIADFFIVNRTEPFL